MLTEKAKGRSKRRVCDDRARSRLGEYSKRCFVALAEQEFDVFVTSDQNLQHQQNLKKFDLAIVVLVAVTNDIDDLKHLMPAANKVLSTIRSGEIVYIKAPTVQESIVE